MGSELGHGQMEKPKNRSREESKRALEHSHEIKRMWEEISMENDQMMGQILSHVTTF